MAKALNTAMADAMHADKSVLVFGEDVGMLGGVFRSVARRLARRGGRLGVGCDGHLDAGGRRATQLEHPFHDPSGRLQAGYSITGGDPGEGDSIFVRLQSGDEEAVKELFALESFTINGGLIFRSTLIGGAVLVLLGTGANVLMAVLYNLTSGDAFDGTYTNSTLPCGTVPGSTTRSRRPARGSAARPDSAAWPTPLSSSSSSFSRPCRVQQKTPASRRGSLRSSVVPG